MLVARPPRPNADPRRRWWGDLAFLGSAPHPLPRAAASRVTRLTAPRRPRQAGRQTPRAARTLRARRPCAASVPMMLAFDRPPVTDPRPRRRIPARALQSEHEDGLAGPHSSDSSQVRRQRTHGGRLLQRLPYVCADQRHRARTGHGCWRGSCHRSSRSTLDEPLEPAVDETASLAATLATPVAIAEGSLYDRCGTPRRITRRVTWQEWK
jgi:hypothetical protein